MNLTDIKKKQDEVAKEFVDAIPYDAWRFFGPHSEIKLEGHFLSLSKEGDMFEIGCDEFAACLEYWVNQWGGEITWKK